MVYVITGSCIEVRDASCVQCCPVDNCIAPGLDQYYINPKLCIDCGLCVPECPVSAIFLIDDVPNNQKEFINKNMNYFRQ